jgi:glycosyltransferase involved in cell wall biosynthesis
VLVRCDVVAHPSWAEGFPNAVLEAMCAARPVVATRVGGIPEVVVHGETGVLVEARRPELLAAAIEQLVGDPLGARVMGLRGRQRVEAVYSLDRMCRAVERMYEALALPTRRTALVPVAEQLRLSG